MGARTGGAADLVHSGVAVWARRVGLSAVAVLVIEYAAVHLLPGVRESWAAAGGAAPLLLGGGLLLELGSMASYSGLTRALLPRVQGPSYREVLATDLTGLGVSHVVPGGGATAAALRVRLYDRVGLGTADAVALSALEYAVVLLWLVATLLLGLVVAVPYPRTGSLVRTAVVLAVVVVMALGGVLAVLMQRPDQVVSVSRVMARRLPGVGPAVVERVVRSLITQVELVRTSTARTRRAVLWGLANWSFDAASLYLCVLAFGWATNPGGLLTAYSIASLLALVPITPGGLGLVEGVAVPALVSFGVTAGPALLGVLAWRLFSFWLPIPLAAGAYLWLRYGARRSPDVDRRVHRVATTPGRSTHDV